MRLYFDHNATSPLRPEARDAMLAVMDLPGNASSIHAEGRAARAAVEAARAEVAALVGAAPEHVTFTSGATEANNWVLSRFPRRLVSALEHPSIRNFPGVDFLPATAEGVVDSSVIPSVVEGSQLDSSTPLRSGRNDSAVLVSLMWVNNETGAIQPVAAAAALAHERGAAFHTDATQAAGRLKLGMAGIDYLTLSAHKLGGPLGVGALITNEVTGQEIAPLLHGGTQENRRRAGTVNVPAIVGFGAAARLAREQLDHYQRLAVLRDRLETALKATASDVTIFAAAGPRVANTTLYAVPGWQAALQLMQLDLAGIAVSSGAACSSGKVEPSPVLRAMGIADDLSTCAIRVSLGWSTTEAEVAEFIGKWQDLYRRRGRH